MKQPSDTLNAMRHACLLAIVILGLVSIVGTGGGGGHGSKDGSPSDDDVTYYLDGDGDTYGDPAAPMESDSQPDGYVTDNTDCDDANAAVHPGAAEICADGIDNDCDGRIDEEACSDLYFRNSLGMSFNLIFAGTFLMGSPESEPGRNADEIEHQVTLTHDFYMQTTEVTQGQWMAVMDGANPSYFSRCGDDCPVELVSWYDVQNFITALNAMGEGIYRLPTEAEWEYAARAGSTTAFANGPITMADLHCRYNDSNLDVIGWYCYNANDTTQGVAENQPNAWGLYDMHGNVWEWVGDWYRDYSIGHEVDPTGPANGDKKVLRGGCWDNFARDCRSANRNRNSPENRNHLLGFRLVMVPVK